MIRNASQVCSIRSGVDQLGLELGLTLFAVEDLAAKNNQRRSGEGASGATKAVSGPVVQPRVETHTRFIMNGYLRMKHGRGRCNGIEMISRGSLNRSSLFCFSYYV